MAVTRTGLATGARVLIVHKLPLVAEDLREVLLSVGPVQVELASELPEMPPNAPFDLCFLSATRDDLADRALLDRASQVARHVVLIVGSQSHLPDLSPNFTVLVEPFRTEDVMAVLASIPGA